MSEDGTRWTPISVKRQGHVSHKLQVQDKIRMNIIWSWNTVRRRFLCPFPSFTVSSNDSDQLMKINFKENIRYWYNAYITLLNEMSIPIMPITPLAISVYLALRFPSGVHRSQPQASDFIDIVVRSCPVRSAPLSLSTIYGIVNVVQHDWFSRLGYDISVHLLSIYYWAPRGRLEWRGLCLVNKLVNRDF